MLYGFQLSPRKVSPHLSNQEFWVASFSAPGRFHLRLPCMDLGGLRRQGKFKKPCYENWKDPEMQTVGGGFKKIQKRVWNGKIKKQLKSTNKKQLKSWPQCQPLKCQEKWPMSLMSITNVNPEKDRCSLEGLEGFQKLKILSETGLFFEDGFKTLSSPPWTQKGIKILAPSRFMKGGVRS